MLRVLFLKSSFAAPAPGSLSNCLSLQGDKRKLQTEIDRTLKKVQEGVEVFDLIWEKAGAPPHTPFSLALMHLMHCVELHFFRASVNVLVSSEWAITTPQVYDPDAANQRDKNEDLLKKEIKKLQRYRDQIKTWAASSEIKDKKALLDARKVIEQKMERFKVCEKETKTKAFSKEGLGQQPKADPKERARAEARDWVNSVVDEITTQLDGFEAEIESLTSGKKTKQKPPRLVHLEESASRHKEHILKLEQVRAPRCRTGRELAWRRQIGATTLLTHARTPPAQVLRLVDNEAISPEDLNDVKVRKPSPLLPAQKTSPQKARPSSILTTTSLTLPDPPSAGRHRGLHRAQPGLAGGLRGRCGHVRAAQPGRAHGEVGRNVRLPIPNSHT